MRDYEAVASPELVPVPTMVGYKVVANIPKVLLKTHSTHMDMSPKRRNATKDTKTRLSLTLTQVYMDALERLVEKGIYLGYQVAIRDAMRCLFQYHGIEPFSTKKVRTQGEAGTEANAATQRIPDPDL